MLFSPEYQAVLREMHAREGWGRNGAHYSADYMGFVVERGCKTLLDYGSGRETLRTLLAGTHPDIDVRCYDPGIPGREAMPAPADFVACTDTLEHIEEDCIEDVLTHIRSLTLRAGYLRCTTSKAKRILPDGRNAHLLLRPRAWWLEQFVKHGFKLVRQDGGTKTVIVWVTTGK